MTWSPEPDETLVHRGPVRFASGRAEKVAGMRWFRDETGRDIAAELPGWPEGPRYSPHSDATARRNKVLGGAIAGVVTVVAGVIEAVTTAGGDVASGDGATPTDHAAEVDDFPVMVAPAGSIARTLPHQLDPDRRGKLYRTEWVVTDRRMVILGTDRSAEAEADAGPEPADVLWEGPRALLGSVVKNGYGTDGADLTLGFADGSWVRLQAESAQIALFLAYELCPAARVEVPETAIKKLAFRIGKTTADQYWIAVRQDDGNIWAQRVTPTPTGPPVRDRQERITKWVEQTAGPED